MITEVIQLRRHGLEKSGIAIEVEASAAGKVHANVTELVPPGGAPTQRAGSLASNVMDGRAVRTAGAGHRPGAELEGDPPLPIRDEPP